MTRETATLEAMKKSKSESETKVTHSGSPLIHHNSTTTSNYSTTSTTSKAPKISPSSAKSSREQVYSILSDEDGGDGFHAHLVVPDVLDKAPTEKLPVSFGDSAPIVMGNLLVPEDLRYKPIIDLSRCDPKKFYTLIFSDPDCPNRSMPTEREHLHWLVVNITDNNVSKGEEIAPYKSPLPNLGTGLHRYVFILLEQTRPITIATEAEKAALAAARESKLESEAAVAAAAAAPKMQMRAASAAKGGAHQRTTMNTTTVVQATQAGKGSPAASDRASNPFIPDQMKRNSFDDNENLLVDRIQFSTKGFMRKYAIIGVAAANFFQTEYNEYVGKQLDARRRDSSNEKKKEIAKEINKIDEKKTLNSLKSLKVGKA